jgi:hypothetical protein
MDRLKEANQRLDAALKRLDRAVQSSGGGGDADLVGALEETKAEHKALRDAADQVTRRLDETVSRLQKLLKE